jgi:RNA polymerase sigma-70 factor (ECF subfamily)
VLTGRDEPQPEGDPEQWLAAAREGSQEALGKLLKACQHYLLLVANEQLPGDLQAKIGASDIVQDTFLEAQRDFNQFAGTTEAELLGWLRRMLLNNMANVNRHYREADKRTVRREVALVDGSSADLQGELVGPIETPSAQAIARESDQDLQRALVKLSEVDRQVIQWRNYERCDFAEIGRRLGRSAEAARKVWTRALEALQTILEGPG